MEGGDSFGSDGTDGGFGSEGTGGPAGPGPSEGAETDSDYGGGLGISMGEVGVGDGGLSDSLASIFSDVSPDFGFSDPSWGDFGAGINYGDSLANMFAETQNNPLSELFQGKLGKGILALLGMADKTGVVSQLGKFGSLATSPNPAKGMANIGLSMGLNAIAPGLGMFAGPIGNATGLSNAFSGTVGLQGGQPANSGVGGMLEGLGGMYSAYKGMSDSGKMLGGLQGLYSQNSPYAQQMRQSLQRRDAAGGRRSQYGPREVELQAKLAQMASSQIPAMNQLQQRQNMNRAIMLQQGLGAFNSMGGLQGLKDLFGLGGAGGMFDTSATNLINSGSLGSLFSNNPFENSVDQSWIPDYGDPFGGP